MLKRSVLKCLVKLLKILSKLSIFKLKSISVIMALYQPAKNLSDGRPLIFKVSCVVPNFIVYEQYLHFICMLFIAAFAVLFVYVTEVFLPLLD